MNRLSDRLMLIGQQIEQNETMADIGTDHGFLPIYLIETGICQKVILTDVSAGSLAKAKSNAALFLEEEAQNGETLCMDDARFDFRLGDGISVLKPGEADCIVIAGMGGVLISEILKKNMETARSAARLILQPRNGVAKLRFFLAENGFTVTKELLVREGKFICEILVASFTGGSSSGSSAEKKARLPFGDMYYEIPELLLENGELSEEFIRRKIRTKRRILAEIAKSKSLSGEEYAAKKKLFSEQLAYCEEMLRRCQKRNEEEKRP